MAVRATEAEEEAGGHFCRVNPEMLTCPGLELSHTMTSSSVAISGGLSLTSSTWTVTGTWLRRLGLSAAGETKKRQNLSLDKKKKVEH